MLTITVKQHEDDIYNTTYEWHIDKKFPDLSNPEEIKFIEASGDEAQFIIDNFSNIPYLNANFFKQQTFIIWRGDFAQFIVDNLNGYNPNRKR